MGQRHYVVLAGPTTVEVTDRVDLEGWELTEKAEEGEAGSGTLWIADPEMDLDLDGLRDYYVIEDDSEATDNVLFGGIVVDPTLSRGETGGTHYDPVSRFWQVSLVDRNGYWNRRVMVGTDCKRPAETDVARMQWLLGTSEAGWIEDDTTYVSTAGPSAMDKVDYRGQYLNQIVDDGAQHTGKNWWVQLQETGTGREDVAWYGKDSLTAYTSDLFLSNDPADFDEATLLDGTSLVWPIADQTRLTRDTARIYTGGYVRYATGTKAIYRRNAASVAVYGVRDMVADYPNVKTKAKANARATRLLADLANPDERITTTVELPAAKATMLRAGMRVQFKATHLEGYTSWRWLRVLSCTVSPTAAGERYTLTLELQGTGTAAGGPPYTGSAFAALLASAGYDSAPNFSAGFYTDTGDSPPAGWYLEPTVGDMWTLSTDQYTGGITTSRAMRVRIEAVIKYAAVSDPGGSATFTIFTTSGGAVGTATVYYGGGGLGYWEDILTVDVEVDLQAGDKVYWTTTDTHMRTGGFSSTFPDHSYVRVGRGTHVWNLGTVTWVGP